jgi:DNA invertase Pin-like site-specific DNA recombinase
MFNRRGRPRKKVTANSIRTELEKGLTKTQVAAQLNISVDTLDRRLKEGTKQCQN